MLLRPQSEREGGRKVGGGVASRGLFRKVSGVGGKVWEGACVEVVEKRGGV